MALAVYYAPDPNQHIRTMAKRYKKLASSKNNKRSLGFIIKSQNPSLLVSNIYDELSRTGDR